MGMSGVTANIVKTEMLVSPRNPTIEAHSLAMKEHVETLDRLATMKSRSEKIALLKEKLENPEFRKIVDYTLNPHKTFGISDYDIEPEMAHMSDVGDFFTFMDKLIARQITGKRARLLAGVYALHGDNLERILEVILQKDLNCGVGVKTVNEAYPGLIPEFNICKAEDYRNKPEDFPFYQAPKVDGMRGLAMCQSLNDVSLRSGDGFELGALSDLRRSVGILYDEVKDPFVLDAELDAGSLADTLSQVKRRREPTTPVYLRVFDFVPLNTFFSGTCRLTLEQRLDMLDSLLGNAKGLIQLLPQTLVHNDAEVQALFEDHLEQGYEGSMMRQPKSLYDLKRSWAWQKLKLKNTLDLKVIGMIEGSGANKGMLGSLICDFNGVAVHVFGYKREQRIEFWKMMPSVIEVKYQNITPDGSLRHCRFVRVRHDKS